MKSTTLPALRVEPKVRKQIEDTLGEGETLSSFLAESVSRNLERRRASAEFLARGLAHEKEAQRSGRYIPASDVMKRLSARLARAKGRKR